MTNAQAEARAVAHPLGDDQIEEYWPGENPAEIRKQFDALMSQLRLVWHRSFPRHHELFAQVSADKAQELPVRIAALQTALDGLPDHWRQWQWYAVPKPVFGERKIRSVYGDNGHGMGRQVVAAVPADRHYFGTVADFIAAANPDTIQLLLSALAAKDAEIAALKKEAADVVRPFAEMPLEGTFGGPLCGAKGLYEDGSEPEYNPDRSILGREPFCAARSFLDTLERRDG
jgi:hypothetical protein